jgi:hypothetical protein
VDSLNNYTLQELVDISNVTVDCTYTLEKSGEVAFAVDSLSWTFSLYPYYFETDSGNYFASNNRITNSIDIYSMGSGQMIKRVSFPKEGPGSVTRLDNFDIHSYDSVYIFDKGDNSLRLIDLNGKFKDSYFFPDLSRNEITTNVSTQFRILDNVFVAARLPFMKNTRAFDSALVATYNIETGYFQYEGPKFIKAITSKPYFASFSGPVISFAEGKNIALRIGALPFVYKHNVENHDLTVHQLKSQFHDAAAPPAVVDKSGYQANTIQNFTRDYYYTILYDSFRQVYYTVYLLGVDPEKYTDTSPTSDDKTISIIIADTAFNYLGEFVLPKNTYQRSFWVSREGLMISTSHPKNPTLDEDTMRYATFKLKRVE